MAQVDSHLPIVWSSSSEDVSSPASSSELEVSSELSLVLSKKANSSVC
ncbi:hypothetical protein COLO4_08209 [Corchorus olitorius]|uniref:Uncharacterized protein n=1 Tax=Corchorus olitorius TaxID=93759 RepID=A0A1R3KGU0_9ROSI|nr:hypothetical protein COLO4_08209 [Corchorus olitorius]